MTRTITFAAAIAALSLVGCATETAESQPQASICDNFDTAYDTIVAGLTKTGANALLQVRYVSSSPAPPAEGDNQWTVQLLDMAGAPLTTGAMTKVKPWMPDHGHGTTIVPTMSAMDADGMVDVTDIDFRMPGVWTLTFTAETGGKVDTATFGVCIN
jgi:hypothetical protein